MKNVYTMGRDFEYMMPAAMAKSLLSSRSGDEKKVTNQKFLCDYVNREQNLLGVCVKVIVK